MLLFVKEEKGEQCGPHGPVVGPIHTSPHKVLEKMDWGGGGKKGGLVFCF